MKKLALLLAVVLLFCSCLSGCHPEHRAMIKEAVRVLENHWAEVYDEIEEDRDIERYFEIKNTRVITLRTNDYEELKDIRYIVDFTLFIDYYGIDDYYVNALYTREGGAVAVYQDGSMKVVSNQLIIYSRYDLAGGPPDEVVTSVDDYGDKYNCKKRLK